MKRIRLGNTVFEGENDVYVLDGERTVLIDAGVAVDAVRSELSAGLAAFGLDLADIDDVFLTHWHYDHAGLAGEIQAASGATVHAHEADAALISGDESTLFAERELQRERFEEWGLPEEPSAELESFLDRHVGLVGERASVTAFEDGATFDLGDVTLEAVHLPGHAAGLVGYAFDAEDWDAADDAGSADDATADDAGSADDATVDVVPTGTGRQAFVGDAILPRYTPNVGGADVRVDRPLAQYADSLGRVVAADWSRAWPGHRTAIDRPARRAARILEHHRERTARVVDALDRLGPASAWAVAADLFGSLSNIHILHGPGEAFAHLDHLAAHEIVTAAGEDPVTYELAVAPDNVAVAELFPSVDAEPLPEA